MVLLIYNTINCVEPNANKLNLFKIELTAYFQKHYYYAIFFHKLP